LIDALGSRGLDIRGLYAHVPFCFHKCHYCDFYSIVDDRDRQAQFTDRLIGELGALGRRVDRPLETVFIGGGTPTLLAPGLWRRLLAAVGEAFALSERLEFTVEANPETVSPELLGVLADGGVNRLSIGAQSFDRRHLETLERWHEPANVGRAVEMARQAGIGEINLDLIFGVPGQTLDEWRADLRRAVALGPTHLACYGLTYEPGTAMTRKLELGRIAPTDASIEAAMYESTIDQLAEAGFAHYEISNWARVEEGVDHRCGHNLMYWRNGSWLAAGPSASGHVSGLRWKNAPHLGRYLAWAGEGAPVEAASVERLDAEASIGEQLMLRLRLLEGAPAGWLDANLGPRRAEVIERHIESGLLERRDGSVRLTRRGLLVADPVIAELL
jgi:oxygen-independent coproporphyrinogen-3 oxidase